MANEVHRKILVGPSDNLFGAAWVNLDGLGDGDLAWGTPITGVGDCDMLEVFFQVKTGTSLTDGGTIDFYAGYGDDDSPEIRSGTGDIDTTSAGTETTAADVVRVLGTLDPIGSIIIDSTNNTEYSRRVKIPSPGDDVVLFVYNNTGAALNSTSSPHLVHYRGWVPEIQ